MTDRYKEIALEFASNLEHHGNADKLIQNAILIEQYLKGNKKSQVQGTD